jgi:hypothetical protein
LKDWQKSSRKVEKKVKGLVLYDKIIMAYRRGAENAEFIFILFSAERAEIKKNQPLWGIWGQLAMVKVH